MTQVNAEQIKNLRETTGAGMLDCRKALIENNGNMDAAVDWLRKKGLSAAAKKSGRIAAEGLVAVATSGNKGAMIELNSETDFVAKNDQFQALAKQIAEKALKDGSDTDSLKAATEADVVKAIATIGENISLRRAAQLGVSKGIVASYVHSATAPGMGKIGILLALESEGNAEKLSQLGKQIAMHIAASRPEAVTTAEVDAAKLERERNVYREQAAASGKPADVIEKMIEGRVRKYYEEVVLMEQVFVVDGKTKISQVVADAAKDVGAPVKITGFVRFQVGEGIEKQQGDFAAEVAAAAGAA
ncbi:MAG: elongation factor Ts [Alphaproteobacteria bacterium]|nr:elongation factor Ts [Alphaproteobacteria bacterium]